MDKFEAVTSRKHFSDMGLREEGFTSVWRFLGFMRVYTEQEKIWSDMYFSGERIMSNCSFVIARKITSATKFGEFQELTSEIFQFLR